MNNRFLYFFAVAFLLGFILTACSDDESPENNIPIANPQSISTVVSTDVTITLSGSDDDGDVLIYSVFGEPTHGSLSGTAPNLTYTPETNYTGSDNFTFNVSDGEATSEEATVTITITEDVPGNTPPTASNQNLSTSPDTAVSMILIGSDVDGDTLNYTVTSSPSYGSLSGTAPNLTYTPETNYIGSDNFTFNVSDGEATSEEATVTITIAEDVPGNTPPTASNQNVNTSPDTTVSIILIGSDVDGDSLNYTVTSNPSHGSLSGTVPNLTYTPETNYIGSDTFMFTVSDGEATSTEATVTVTINDNSVYIERGSDYMGTIEQFNRYYTDSEWQPLRTIYVSRNGNNTEIESNSRDNPAPVQFALSNSLPGDMIYFLRDGDLSYEGCYELDTSNSGTYNNPIVLYAEKDSNGDFGVKINCCNSDRRSCFNLEGANYIAIDGFEMEGGDYGIRSVGLGYDQSEHQNGVAVLNSEGYNQNKDPFFSGQSDWAVYQNNLAHGAGNGDGHGIYLSNGSDWNIVRFNELYNNVSSDFQINADPLSTCSDFFSSDCDGSALDGLGKGVSEYMVVEKNYFHNGRGQGPNFTSVRNSLIRDNVIGLYDRHGTSFWQETNNPNLGSSDNIIESNIFIGETSNRHVLQFVNNSDRNTVRNNILLGITISGQNVSINNSVYLIETDDTINESEFTENYYVGEGFDGYTPNETEFSLTEFSSDWFNAFPFDRMGSIEDWEPTESSPFDNFEW